MDNRMGLLELLRKDAARYGDWYRQVGFWVGATHRFGVWARSFRFFPVRLVLVCLYRLAVIPWRLFLNVKIYADQIGPGFMMTHPRNIMIGPGVELGDNCLVFHEVTIGQGTVPGVPRIGHGVDVYVGARVLGGITVGHASMIGANCVVTRSIPDGSVVSPPAVRILPRSLLARGPGDSSAA